MENEIPPTPIGEEKSEIELIKSFKKSENYEIKFSLANKNLYIQCTDEKFPYPKYEFSYNLNTLTDVQKYFPDFEDINQVCSFIKSINEKDIKMDIKKENIIISIKSTYKEKIVNIDLNLQKAKTDYNQISLNLFNEINKIKEDIKIMKNINDHLISENETIKKQYEDIRAENRLNENKYKNLDEKINNIRNINEDLNGDNQLTNTDYDNLLILFLIGLLLLIKFS